MKSGRELTISEIKSRIQFLACLYQFCKFVGYFFDLAELLFGISVNVPYEHSEEIVFSPDLIMGVDEITDHVLNVETHCGPGNQCNVKGLSVRPIHTRGVGREPIEISATVSAAFRVSLQRSILVAGAISVETVSERDRGSEKSKVRKSLRKSGRECACAEGVTVGQALPCLEQLGELVSKSFNLQQHLLPIPFQIGYDDLDVQLIWQSAREITKRGREVPVPKVGEKVADLPRAKHARNAIQIHVKVPIASINDRSICIQLNEWRSAVFARVGIPLHDEIP